MTETVTQDKNFTHYTELVEKATEHEKWARYHEKQAKALRERSYCDNCARILKAVQRRDNEWYNDGGMYNEEAYNQLNEAAKLLRRTLPCHCGRRTDAPDA